VPPPKDREMKFENVKTAIKGDEATVTYRATIREPKHSMTADEVFRLRRKDGKWQVYENRSWPIKVQGSDFIEEFEPSTWEALDDQASRAEAAGDLGGQVGALMHGQRYADAHNAARKWIDKEPKSAQPWLARAEAAMAVGDTVDAIASFKKALAIDPKASLPEYARLAIKEK
jgi:tetratricopeptide (TPR) repeat protein